MKKFGCLLVMWVIFLWAPAALAGFTETLPKGAFLLDTAWIMSHLDSRWNDRGEAVPLIDETKRYEPGAGKQGILKPKAVADFGIFAVTLQYGILDNLSFGVGLPIVMYTRVDPNFEWEEGDYQWNLGRPFSDEDFWVWAETMGQSKPEPWDGNHGVAGDVQLGLRYRFTDGSVWCRKAGMAGAFMITGALPTGRQPDPEEAISAGTTSWDLHSNGELGFHVGADKFFPGSLDGRLTLGLDLFYEFLFPHTYVSPEGRKNPLLLNYRPYTGKYYTIDGGDFSGFSFQTDVVPWKGEARATRLSNNSQKEAEKLPPMLTLSFRYTFTHLQQTDWESDSAIWDWEREKEWLPGYKNFLYGQATLSLLRVGVPVMPYVGYRNLSWIPGRNARAADVLTLGTRIIMKFW